MIRPVEITVDTIIVDDDQDQMLRYLHDMLADPGLLRWALILLALI